MPGHLFRAYNQNFTGLVVPSAMIRRRDITSSGFFWASASFFAIRYLLFVMRFAARVGGELDRSGSGSSTQNNPARPANEQKTTETAHPSVRCYLLQQDKDGETGHP